MNIKNIVIGIIVILVLALVGGTVIFVFMMLNNQTPASMPPTLDMDAAVAEIADSFTATATQPTETPTIAISPTPHPTRTPLPTWTITTTPSPFPTRTPHPTITPTRSTQEPGTGLGDPTWIDNFETDDYWTLFDDDCFTTDIRGGRYIQTTKDAPIGACWEVTWPKIQDYYLEALAQVSGSCAERDRYGFYFRGLDTRRGYIFGVTCKQEYWLSFWNSNTQRRETLIDYTVSDKINIDPGSYNKLAIQTTGDRILLYVNDSLLAEVYDSTYTQKGLIGLFIGSEVTENFTVAYEYLAYWINP